MSAICRKKLSRKNNWIQSIFVIVEILLLENNSQSKLNEVIY